MSEVGIFSIDPGAHTGVTWGIYPLDAELVKLAMRGRVESGSTTIEGSERQQTNQLFTLFTKFATDHMGTKIELVIEDFSLTPGPHTPGKEGISPVRYAWAFVGFLWGWEESVGNPGNKQKVIWQLPSNAMRYNTKKMLTNWNAWVVGREHERSAFAHVGARLMELYKS